MVNQSIPHVGMAHSGWPILDAIVTNAELSVQRDWGCVRFDVLQQQDDPTRFVFVEVYRTLDASGAHKETRHYQTWRDAVAPMMAEPRSSVKFDSVFPTESSAHHAV